MRRMFFDVETIPAMNPDEAIRLFEAERERNAALVKPHPIEKVQANAEEAWRKTALDPAAGHIFCVVVDTGHDVLTFGGKHEHQGVLYPTNEAQMLRDFAAWAGGVIPGKLIGHNSVGFDRPFLRARALVHGVKLPSWLIRPLKPWDAVSLDTMLLWTGGQPGKTISLDRLCTALGLPGKGDGPDGSQVWDMVKAGRADDVVAYCAADVARTRACYERMSAILDDTGGDDE